jgi:hypothetical protein
MRRHSYGDAARRLALVASLICGSTLGLACVVVQPTEKAVVVVPPPAKGKGPPPHAPAHGYRRKLEQDGVTLELDSGRGVYVVVGVDDVFFSEKRYYRCADERWFASPRPDGGWVVIKISDVPAGLRDYKPKHAKPGKGPQTGKGPKKH